MYCEGGFVPGEPIVFSVCIDNQSKRTADSLTAMIVQQVRLHATSRSTARTRAVISVQLPRDVKPKTRDEFHNLSLVVPAVCSSSNGLSRIIEVNYTFVLSFGARGFSINGNLVIPIKIGTVPFMGSSVDPRSYVPSATVHPTRNVNSNSGMNAPPPSYEACIFGSEMKHDSDDTKGGEVCSSDQDSYRPFYPF